MVGTESDEIAVKKTLSKSEQIIKSELETWVADLERKADLEKRLQAAFKNDKSHSKLLSEN